MNLQTLTLSKSINFLNKLVTSKPHLSLNEVGLLRWAKVCNYSIRVFCSYRVVKRRVLWLIGMWISVKLSVSMRPVVYQTIFKMLHESEDVVVRLEAAFTLRAGKTAFTLRVNKAV